MPCYLCLPSLICGLAMSFEDVRRRRVPRLWVALGALAQLVALLGWAVVANSFFTLIQALLFAGLCAVLQLALALIRPGALGLGDVTATAVMGLAVGAYGLSAVVVWWLFMGAMGLAFLTLWTRFDPQRHTRYRGKAPFAPVIVISAVLAVLFH